MKFGINTLDDFDFKSKTVLVRLDLNSPYNKDKDCLKDITRISAAIPTIKELSDKGAKLVLMSHQGGDLEYKNFVSTSHHAIELSNLLGKNVIFIDDICGPAARVSIKNLKDGQILLLDNVRYMAEEMTLFETKLKLSSEDQAKTIVVKKIAPLGDIYVCDAFAASHRNQPTLVGFEELLPSAMGRLFEKEYEILSKIMTRPDKPCLFLLGGAKVEDTFLMLNAVLGNSIADEVLCGGLAAQVFLISMGKKLGEVSEAVIYGKKLEPYIEMAKVILEKYSDKIILPSDFAYSENGRFEINASALPTDKMISDIGSKSVSFYKDKLSKAKTVFINGPTGIFEEKDSEYSTKELWNHIANLKIFSVIGGGDSITAVNKYNLKNSFSYICTGGGAMVRFLSGEELPVVKALKKSAQKFKK